MAAFAFKIRLGSQEGRANPLVCVIKCSVILEVFFVRWVGTGFTAVVKSGFGRFAHTLKCPIVFVVYHWIVCEVYRAVALDHESALCGEA